MDISYHYPPELLQLLVDTVPLLCKSKKDVLLFIRGAGVPAAVTSDLGEQVARSKDSITKYEIVRVALTRLNEGGEKYLRQRRELLRRVVEFENFSTCWPDDQYKAKGMVADVRKIIDVKDSFTRMKQERDKERDANRRAYEEQVAEVQRRKARLQQVKASLYRLFGNTDAQRRGTEFEQAVNELFAAYGILVKESFRVVGEQGEGVLEQVDGVIALDGEVYLAEVKWLSRSVSVDDVSRHLVRVYHRGASRALFVSMTPFSPAALKVCVEALQRTVVVLCTVEEIVKCLESDADLGRLLLDKAKHAIIHKEPFATIG